MGHTLRIGFSAALPRDFLAADYGRVAIDLAGGYAAGLGADAQIIVEVNGHSAGSVRLSSANGENFLHKRHFLPLSAFRPGQNRIELRVNAPDGAAIGCDTSANAGNVAPRARVWLNATSRIVFPSLARVGRLPDLAMTSSGAFPFAGTDGKMTLVVPTPDRATLGAALTVVARLGVAGRQADSVFVRRQSGRREIWPRSRGRAGACARSGEHAAGSTRPRPGSTGLVCIGRTASCRSRTDLARGSAKACV
jgi:cellulose synthase operon protein B